MIDRLFEFFGLPVPETPRTLDQYAVVVGSLVAIFALGWQALARIARWSLSKILPENRRIKFDTSDSTPIWRGRDRPDFWLATAWFISAEELQPARSVHAFVEVRTRSRANEVKAYCLWAVGSQPGEIGRWKSEENQIDIAADHLPAKLSFAWRQNSLDAREEPRPWQLNSNDQAEYLIASDANRLRISLRGIQVNRSFHFAIRRLESERFEIEHMTALKRLRATAIGRLRARWSW